MPLPRSFVMTASKNDVSGIRSEAYILIPLAARDKNKSFWGWPSQYRSADGTYSRAVQLKESTRIAESRIYFHAGKREFRFCTGLYRSGLAEGALFQIHRHDDGRPDFEIEAHLPGTDEYAALTKFAGTWVSTSNKRWGYVP